MWKSDAIILWIFTFFKLLVQTAGRKGVIMEGDIIVTKNVAHIIQESRGQKSANKRNAIKADIYRWKDGVIPYMISPQIDGLTRQLILRAFAEYQRLTCIKFIKKEFLDGYVDYVKFIADDGCYSAIGRQGGKQEISLGDGCNTFGHVLHELMHCIGFFHEQSRYDRDLYVKILWWNIADGAFKNFASYSHGKVDTLNAPYDKHSILHYGNKAFTKNGGNTVESLDNPNEELGKEQLSIIDIYQLNKLYGCYKATCFDKYKSCEKKARSGCYKDIKFFSEICPKSCGLC